ncbi:MAG: sugar transferase [Caldilinea sp.]|nr:sugar transferase [Caldilinea sp.]HRW46220.1 sugar transferase [Caldilinea sp.]
MTANTNIAVNVQRVDERAVSSLATQRNLYRLFLVIGDATVLLIAFTLAYWLRFSVGITLHAESVPFPQDYLVLSLFLVPLWLVIFAVFGLYEFNSLLGNITEYGKVVNACTWGMMAVMIYGFFNPEFVIARAWLVFAWLLSMFMVSVFRLVMRRIAYRARRAGYFIVPTVIVGTNQEAVALADQLRNSAGSGMEITGFIDVSGTDRHIGDQIHGIPVLGDLAQLPEILAGQHVEEVVVATTAVDGEQLVGISQQLSNDPKTRMRLSSGLYEVFTTGMEVATRNSVPLMSLKRLRLNSVETMLKSALDYALIFLALPVLLPIFAVIAVLIKLDSPGPIFYRRGVLGVGGKPFGAFKFRTMYVNGNQILDRFPDLKAELEREHKLKNDPRITRVGKLLRRTSLDELPQLLNVLFGQMSIVGPRMISPAEHDLYGRMKLNLLTVKPGLTGMWQVSGRSDLKYDDRVRLDMYYIRNYSIWLDVQILFFQTIPAVFKGRGAY